jgi:hypothetical protein
MAETFKAEAICLRRLATGECFLVQLRAVILECFLVQLRAAIFRCNSVDLGHAEKLDRADQGEDSALRV